MTYLAGTCPSYISTISTSSWHYCSSFCWQLQLKLSSFGKLQKEFFTKFCDVPKIEDKMFSENLSAMIVYWSEFFKVFLSIDNLNFLMSDFKNETMQPLKFWQSQLMFKLKWFRFSKTNFNFVQCRKKTQLFSLILFTVNKSSIAFLKFAYFKMKQSNEWQMKDYSTLILYEIIVWLS